MSGLESDPQLGVQLPEGNDAEAQAKAFVESVRQGKCDPDTLNPDGTLALGDPEQACKDIDQGELFAPAVKADREAQPELLGETLDWAFYGVPTDSGYFTLLVHSVQNDSEGQTTEYAISDVLPAGEVESAEKG